MNDYFETDIDLHPEDHFLSPIMPYEYEDWADDTDDDDDEGGEMDWDAGITDFALFSDDRRRAQESEEKIPKKWETVVSSQATAMQRAVQRHRAGAERTLLSAEDVPALTPDGSPRLSDDLEIDTFRGPLPFRPRISKPNPVTITLTPPQEDDYRDAQTFSEDEAEDEDDEDDEDEDELPLSVLLEKARLRRRKLERPGLKHSRTLSGKVHVWRRPSWGIYPVGEEREEEEMEGVD